MWLLILLLMMGADMNAAALAKKGRNGDTTVGHLTPGEIVIPKEVIDNQPQLMAAIIKAFNGYGENMQQPVDWRRYVVGDDEGPTNPETGAEEFFGPSTGTRGMGGGAAFGGVQRDNPDRMSRNGPQSGPSESGRDMMRSTGATAAFGGVQRSMPDRMSAGGPSTNGIGGFLQDVFGLPAWGDEAGWLETGLGVLPGVGTGMAITRGLQSLTGTPGVPGDPNTRDGAPQHGGREGGALSGTTRPPLNLTPAAPAANRYTRPAPINPVFSLNVGGMDDLQQRAAIATRAMMGDDSVYRSDEAKNYYKNLLQRSLINADGSLNGIGQLLPIETQYIQNILGLTYQPTTQSLLDAIATA